VGEEYVREATQFITGFANPGGLLDDAVADYYKRGPEEGGYNRCVTKLARRLESDATQIQRLDTAAAEERAKAVAEARREAVEAMQVLWDTSDWADVEYTRTIMSAVILRVEQLALPTSPDTSAITNTEKL
jgi:hypothetical protein